MIRPLVRNKFEKLAQLAGKTPEQKVAALRMKVSREIMAVIMYRPNKPKKNQWPEWRTFCQGIYNDLEDDKHYTKLRNRDSRQPQTAQIAGPAHANPAQPQTPAQTGGDPMQLDKIEGPGTPGAAARREYRRLHNLCFYCGGAHTVRDCEEKKQNDAKFRRPTHPTHPRGRGGMRGGHGQTTYHQAYQPTQHQAQHQYQPPQPPQIGTWGQGYYAPTPQRALPGPTNRIRILEPGHDTASTPSERDARTPASEVDSYIGGASYTSNTPENE